MKMIVLVAVLAAAGCSKKRSDCDAAIAKAMDSFAASIKADSPNPQVQETRLTVIGKLRGTLTQRCTEDKWPAEVVSCFTTVVGMKDMQACQAKLNEAQRTRLLTEIRQVMMGSMGQRMMPSGMAGHPAMLAGSGAPGGAAVPAGSAVPPAAGSAASTTSGSAAAPAAGSAAAPAAGSAVAPAAGAGAK
jgi:hypothetical protein